MQWTACKKVSNRCEHVTDFVKSGIELLNVGTKETNNGRTGDTVQHTGIFFRKVA
jgi:hypothetical protein